MFPSPNDVISTFFQLFTKKNTYTLILFTLLRLLGALGISLIVGIFLGILSGLWRPLELFLKPYITILRSMPVVVLLILFLMIAGIQSTPYLITFLVLIPLFYEASLKGVKEIDQDLTDVWKLESKLHFGVIKKIIFPLSFPYIAQAIVAGIGLGFKVLIMGEYMASTKNSIGNIIISNAHNLEYTSVYAWCIVLILLVLFVEFLPKLCIYIYQKLKEKHDKKNQVIDESI